MSPEVRQELARIRAIPDPPPVQRPAPLGRHGAAMTMPPQPGLKARRARPRADAILTAVGAAGALSIPAIATAIGAAPKSIREFIDTLVDEGSLVRVRHFHRVIVYRLPGAER